MANVGQPFPEALEGNGGFGVSRASTTETTRKLSTKGASYEQIYTKNDFFALYRVGAYRIRPKNKKIFI